MLHEFEFGPEAISYIEACLSRGGPFAHSLLENLPLQGGRAVSFLPSGVSDTTARRFMVGGVTQAGPAFAVPGGMAAEISRVETLKPLMDMIAQYLASPGKRYAILEDRVASPGDSYLAGRNLRFFTHGPSVCYYFTSEDKDPTLITKARNYAAAGDLFIGCLTSLPDEVRRIEDRQEVSDKMLQMLAARADNVLVGAYDNEGELIWSRRTE